MRGIGETCGDDRFELIAKAKAELLDATNIESSPMDMAALDSILFRCWQMGWLDNLRMGECETNNKTGDSVTHDSGVERTCRQEERGWGTEGDHARVWLTCGHDCMVPTVQDLPNYCPDCGAKVVER